MSFGTLDFNFDVYPETLEKIVVREYICEGWEARE